MMTIDNIIDALSNFILPFCVGATIVRGQTNRVSFPKGSCVVLTEMHNTNLGMAYENLTDILLTISSPKQIDIQADFYGPESGDWAAIVSSIFRTSYACSQFPDGLAPLFCSDPFQGPLIDGEQQYENRWTLTASLEYNPAITVSFQSANKLSINRLEDL